MKGLLLLFILITVSFTQNAFSAQQNTVFTVRTDRPRLLIDSTDLARVGKSLLTYGKEDFKAISNYALRRLAYTPASKLAETGYDYKIVASVALAGILGKDETLIQLAVEYAIAMAETAPSADDDTVQRSRLIAMAYIYDWLNVRFTEKQKIVVRDGIIAHIKYLSYFLDDRLYTGGHSRYGSTAIMAGLIALSTEDWLNERDRLLSIVNTQWVNGYNPFQAFVAAEGGYHMGWRYGLGYTDPLPYLLWEKATGIRWGEEWRKNQIYWLIYGVRGDGTFSRFGDCWNTTTQDDYVSAIAAVSPGIFKNSSGEWFYRTYLAENFEPRRIHRLLFRDPAVVPLAPSDSTTPLPLARHFAGAGFVVARDSWDSEATHLVFKSSPFYTRNHHHKDQNHFELSYKGSLLADTGVYDAFSSSHWKNYYTRTVAHNSLVVYDPNESFSDGNPVSNDGGQQFLDENAPPVGREPANLEETRADKYRLNGLTGFSARDGVSWMRGDASKSYDPRKVLRYNREILMVNRPVGRRHPFMVVVDRVSLAKPLTPTILFHSNEKPIITENGFEIANPAGGIVTATVAAKPGIKMAAVGGPGKEWWVNGRNYPPQSGLPAIDVDAGGWRMEITVDKVSKEAEFVTFLAVDDAINRQKVDNVQIVSGEGYAGAIADEGLYLICTPQSSAVEWRFDGPLFDKVRKVYVGGLPITSEYFFILNGRTLSSAGSDVIVAGQGPKGPMIPKGLTIKAK